MTIVLLFILVFFFLFPPTGWGLSPTDPYGIELISYQLVHSNWEHLLSNLVVLAGFGGWFEYRRGGFQLLLLLTVAGIMSGLAEALADPTYNGVIIGASGAVSALLGAFGRFERWGFLVVFPVLIFYSYEALQPGGTFADWAHLCGFSVGLLWALVAPKDWVELDSERRSSVPQICQKT